MPRNKDDRIGSPFKLRLAKGYIPGHDYIDKFGAIDSLTVANSIGATIWSGADDSYVGSPEYVFTADSGAGYFISSTNAGDTQLTQVYVLSVDSHGNWNREVIEVELQGQTKLPLLTPSGDPCVRVYRAINIGTTDYLGDVYIYEDDTVNLGKPSTPSKVRAIIQAGENQTLMAVYTVPSGYVGFLTYGDVMITDDANQPESARGSYRSRRYGGVFAVKKKIKLTTQGTAVFQEDRRVPDIIPSKTDILIQTDSVTSTLGVSSSFDILLVEEDLVSPNRLEKIGQIRYID